MTPIVDLAPGADTSVIARYFADRIREAIEKPRLLQSFVAMKATVFVVDFDSGEAATLRFDHGRLTLHEGTIGMPTVTFGGPRNALLSLDRVKLGDLPQALLGTGARVSLADDARRSSPPPASNRRGPRLELREILRLFSQKELRVYGLWSHPRTTVRFLRLVAG